MSKRRNRTLRAGSKCETVYYKGFKAAARKKKSVSVATLNGQTNKNNSPLV